MVLNQSQIIRYILQLARQIIILEQISNSMSSQREYRYDELELRQQRYAIRHGDRIDESEVLEIIRQEFRLMFEDGYDFRYRKYQKIEDEERRKLKHISYRVKLKYMCKNEKCKRLNDRMQKSNEWTSNFGLIQFGYIIQSLRSQYLKTLDYKVYLQKLVIYSVRFGKQLCITCQNSIAGLISREEAVLLTRVYCCFIRDKLEHFKRPDNQMDKQKSYKSSDPHLQDLCDPCRQGKCKYSAHKQMKKRKQHTRRERR